MDRPRLIVDFNEMLEPDLVLLSRGDVELDSAGTPVRLEAGVRVYVYCPDSDEHGNPDALLADGRVEANGAGGWSSAAKWCARCTADAST